MSQVISISTYNDQGERISTDSYPANNPFLWPLDYANILQNMIKANDTTKSYWLGHGVYARLVTLHVVRVNGKIKSTHESATEAHRVAEAIQEVRPDVSVTVSQG